MKFFLMFLMFLIKLNGATSQETHLHNQLIVIRFSPVTKTKKIPVILEKFDNSFNYMFRLQK